MRKITNMNDVQLRRSIQAQEAAAVRAWIIGDAVKAAKHRGKIRDFKVALARIENADHEQRRESSTKQAIGYSDTGLSIYTRQSARHVPEPRMASSTIGRIPRGGHGVPLSTLIEGTAGALRTLQCELTIEDNPTRRAKIEKSIAIKTDFLAKLKEQEAAS